jgi:hypothetical protein
MVKPRPMPAFETLQERFEYEPDTGLLRFKVGPNRRYKAGDIAGTTQDNGYVVVTLAKRPLLVHRVAWKLMTGEEPPVAIDHKDRNRSNNRWSNLRASDMQRNQGNRIGRGTRRTKWGWEAWGGGNYLGTYNTEKEAHQTYVQWHLSYFGTDSVYSAETES